MSIPLEGGKRAGKAVNSVLTGDIYTRRWVTKKKGKKPEIEHELRVNPVSIGLGAIAAGVTAVGAGMALWLMQKKVVRSDTASWVRVVDYHPGTTPYWIVKNSRGVPMWRVKDISTFSAKEHALTQKERGYKITAMDIMKTQNYDWGTRTWFKFTTDSKHGYGLGDRTGFLS